MPTNEEQLPVADEGTPTQETDQHRLPTSIMSSSSALDTAMSRACKCGICALCQLRLAILAFGEEHKWSRFFYTVCSAVAEGEYYWHLFVYMHELDDLRWVMRAIETAQETRDNTSTTQLAVAPLEPPSAGLWS